MKLSVRRGHKQGRHQAPSLPDDLPTQSGGSVAASDPSVDEDSVDFGSAAEGASISDDVRPSSSLGRGSRVRNVIVFTVLPTVVIGVTAMAGYLKYQADTLQAAQTAAVESVQAASDGTAKILTYHADSADKDLAAARDGLTGTFRDDYTKLTREVVIPGAKEKSISTVATVPAASSVSASADHAVVLVFIDQTVSMRSDAPTSTSSSVKVTLDKQNGRWLISGFNPI